MDNFVELHRNALVITTQLLAHLDDTQRQFVEGAVAGGARLVMELGPLPDAQRVAVVLVEREGPQGRRLRMRSTLETIAMTDREYRRMRRRRAVERFLRRLVSRRLALRWSLFVP
jgi:hypothetical protein